MIEVEAQLNSLAIHIESYAYRYFQESRLQEGVGVVLSERMRDIIREARLSPSDRPDFFLPELGIAVELKTKDSLTALTRQVQRYALLEQVRGVLVVTPLRRLCALPAAMAGVPVRVAYLENSVF